jgi:hypothetical protein|tara:strand:- start:291 stop:470 length:180 start_codon:yes stop_codon:yes gene_type:complete
MDEFSNKEIAKMKFIYNAIEDGWCIKKKDRIYIFKKNHENKKKYVSEDFLKKFILKYNK